MGKEVKPIKPLMSKRNIKEATKRVFRIFGLLLGIFFVIIGVELFLFVHDETVYGVVFFLIGVGFLLHFYTTRKGRELKPFNFRSSNRKEVKEVTDERRKHRKESS